MLKNFIYKIFTLTNLNKICILFIFGFFSRVLINNLFSITIDLDNVKFGLFSYFFLFTIYIKQSLNLIDFKYLHYYLYKIISLNQQNITSYFTDKNNKSNNSDLSFFNKFKRNLYWHFIEKNNKAPLDSWERIRYNSFLKNWNSDKKLLIDFVLSKNNSIKTQINAIKWILDRRNPKN